MNSFNRLLLSYIDLSLIEKILYDYNRKNAQIFVFSKKMPIFVIQKKTIKITIMERKSEIGKRRNYRITIILKDEVIVERFYREDIAIKTVTSMQELFPELFVGGAVEKMDKKRKVVWASKLIGKK